MCEVCGVSGGYMCKVCVVSGGGECICGRSYRLSLTQSFCLSTLMVNPFSPNLSRTQRVSWDW